MLIWLTRQRAAAGGMACEGQAVTETTISLAIAPGVVPRETFARLVGLDEAVNALETERAAILDEAHAQARAILADASANAEARDAAARRRFDEAYTQGFAAGELAALEKWHEKVLGVVVRQGDLYRAARQRLAQMITVAIQKIVLESDHAALFARACLTLDQIAADAAWLRIRVSPSDHRAAADVFEQLEQRWKAAGGHVRVEMTADPALPEGSCVCESDLGIIDASLQTQLRAIHAAVDALFDGGHEGAGQRHSAGTDADSQGNAAAANPFPVSSVDEASVIGLSDIPLAACPADEEASQSNAWLRPQ